MVGGEVRASPACSGFWDFIAESLGTILVVYRGPLPPLPQAWFGVLSYEFGKDFHAKKKNAGNQRLPTRKTPDYYFFKPARLWPRTAGSKEYFLFGRGVFGK